MATVLVSNIAYGPSNRCHLVCLLLYINACGATAERERLLSLACCQPSLVRFNGRNNVSELSLPPFHDPIHDVVCLLVDTLHGKPYFTTLRTESVGACIASISSTIPPCFINPISVQRKWTRAKVRTRETHASLNMGRRSLVGSPYRTRILDYNLFSNDCTTGMKIQCYTKSRLLPMVLLRKMMR